MKKIKSPLRLFMQASVLAILLSGCSNNDASEADNADVSQDLSAVVQTSQVDASSDAADDIALDIFEAQERSEFGRTPPHFDVPDCVTVVVTIENNSRHIEIDFGTDGCVIRGNTLKGVINMYYERDPEAQQVLITKTYIDFYFNDKQIMGGKSILKEASNENGNPQFAKTVDIVVIWDNGDEASRTGTKIREWIEGHGSGIFSDNVFQITGNWTTSFRDGHTHSHEVIIPLRREVICRYFVSGSVDIERHELDGVLDFGSGDCDNMATFTTDEGEVIDITLNR